MLTNQKKAEIIKNLEKGKFLLIENSFNYLLQKSLLSLSYEEIEKLKKDQENNKKEIDLLKKTTKEQLWLNDLENFEKEWKEFQDNGKKQKVENKVMK